MVNYISLVHNCLHGQKWSQTNRRVTWRRWLWAEKGKFFMKNLRNYFLILGLML